MSSIAHRIPWLVHHPSSKSSCRLDRVYHESSIEIQSSSKFACLSSIRSAWAAVRLSQGPPRGTGATGKSLVRKKCRKGGTKPASQPAQLLSRCLYNFSMLSRRTKQIRAQAQPALDSREKKANRRRISMPTFSELKAHCLQQSSTLKTEILEDVFIPKKDLSTHNADFSTKSTVILGSICRFVNMSTSRIFQLFSISLLSFCCVLNWDQ